VHTRTVGPRWVHVLLMPNRRVRNNRGRSRGGERCPRETKRWNSQNTVGPEAQPTFEFDENARERLWTRGERRMRGELQTRWRTTNEELRRMIDRESGDCGFE